MAMNRFSKKQIGFLLCVFFSLLGSLLSYYIGKYYDDTDFVLGNFILPSLAIQGIISSSRSILCILMVLIAYRKGMVTAIILTLLALLFAFLRIVRFQDFSSLPGIFNIVFSIITIAIIYSFYKKSEQNSRTDFITGLRNRRSYVEEVSAVISHEKPFCLACIEVEDFKELNDIFGIQIGDYILERIAKKLSGVLSKNDIIFKITGATYAILFALPDPAHHHAGDDSFVPPETRLSEVLNAEVIKIPAADNTDKTLERNCTVTLCAGLAYADAKKAATYNASKILKNAEAALFATKRNPDCKLCVFTEEMENQEQKQKEAEFLIKDSLENNWFYLVYQPQFTTGEKKLRGFETLIRCKKPDGTIVSPGYFIPAAEKTSLIMKIDDYVLRRAMTEFKPILGSTGKDCIISINVSAKNIGSKNFADRIKAMLEETKFPPKNLEIEITEYSFSDSMETTVENINMLKALGVQIALDDFGTGYTSIAKLMKLPINLLKIDKSLIDDIESNSNVMDMVDSVIYMGHIMNCEVISEGVENEKQLELLKKHNCDFIQGFVWGKPKSYDEAKALYNEQS